MKYKIADVIIEMEPTGRLIKQAERYKTETDSKPSFTVDIGDIERYNSKEREYSLEEFQYLYSGTDFYRQLLNYNGMMLHSSAVVVDNNAYLFSAASGTGKSTHTSFWLKKFGDRAYILNDDKPAIRIMDGGIYAYGTPWSGKYDISINKRVKLKGICIIERAETNTISRMDSQTALIRLMHGALKKLTPEQLDKQLAIINNLIKNVPIYRLGCTPTSEAADLAYETMSK